MKSVRFANALQNWKQGTVNTAILTRSSVFENGFKDTRDVAETKACTIRVRSELQDGNLIGCRRLWLSWCVSRYVIVAGGSGDILKTFPRLLRLGVKQSTKNMG